MLLTSYADLVFEGMSIAGLVTGAKKGLLYVRGEYRYLLDPLKSALAARRKAGLLGENILGTRPADGLGNSANGFRRQPAERFLGFPEDLHQPCTIVVMAARHFA